FTTSIRQPARLSRRANGDPTGLAVRIVAHLQVDRRSRKLDESPVGNHDDVGAIFFARHIRLDLKTKDARDTRKSEKLPVDVPKEDVLAEGPATSISPASQRMKVVDHSL